MDLDCIGSMVLARHLFPGYVAVRSHLIHPVARNLYNLYENHLGFRPSRDLSGEHVESMVVVDTRSSNRLREFFDVLRAPPEEITVFDHHRQDSGDLEGAVVHERECGANTTLLGLQVMDRGLSVNPDDATIALIGLYADTGRFTHQAVRSEDFTVAAYLMDCGASLEITEHLLRSLRENHQIDLFHVLLNNLIHRNINGHAVLLSYLELEENRPGLAAVVEKVFEVEDADALCSVFGLRKQNRSLMIGRSRKDSIDLARLFGAFGGGGHTHAASAVVRSATGLDGRGGFGLQPAVIRWG